MTKILMINTCNFGSTGNIMLGIKETAKMNGYNVATAIAKSRSNKKKRLMDNVYIGSIMERNSHILTSMLTGFNGCFSVFTTWRFLKRIKQYSPDIIHLHNLHGWYINLPMLFFYIKKNNIKVVWTLHDCWAFTGQCPHFTITKCNKWKSGCYDCPSYREYPGSYVDRTRIMYKLKKKWFTGVSDLTIVTPSEWLAKLVKESFLKEYDVKVINNGIDLSVFKPTESNLRKQLNLEGKYVLLGVASPFTNKKGLDIFVELADRLSDEYKIVLVGLTKEQIFKMPDNIIGMGRTSSQEELAKFYTMADIFINPTREDNFPTVNIEALACGTPTVTFRTGGSPEIIDDTCGSVVDCNDIEALQKEIVRICEERPYYKDSCLKRTMSYDMNKKFTEYLMLYNGEV